MSNPGSTARPTEPTQPRSVSPGVQHRPYNVGAPLYGVPRSHTPPPNAANYSSIPPQTTGLYHAPPQGVLAPSRSQQIYTQPVPQQLPRHQPIPQQQMPLFSTSQYGSYPVHAYSHYPTHAYDPYPAYSIPYANVQPYAHIGGFKQPKESERRITYHPYTRYYTDYEERVTMVPVEKVRTKYYEKIFETNFIPKAIQEHVMQVKPVEKTQMKVEYVPVERKIIHLPKDEKLYQIINPEKHPQLLKRIQEQPKTKPFEKLAENQLRSNPSQKLYNLEAKSGQRYEEKAGRINKGNIRESHVQEVYSSKNDGTGERDRYTIRVN